jgi:hypothetical protein
MVTQAWPTLYNTPDWSHPSQEDKELFFKNPFIDVFAADNPIKAYPIIFFLFRSFFLR